MSLRLRRHQALALGALDRAGAQGRRRAWVELPPGAGKTLVGLETARRLLDPSSPRPVRRAVVLGPNTAIQGQWLDQARALGLSVGSERTLAEAFTALTYQSLAVFDPDAEVGDDPTDDAPLMARLHDNGRALVEALRAAGPLLLVLDECHHLLEVWGRLLGELLDLLPDAVVLGLTATPPETMTREQAALVGELFGAVVFEASIPAVVREGDLAPFAELAWLTVPTTGEQDWLATEATRFQELVTQLTDPDFGSLPFLSWLDARFRADELPWPELVRLEPALSGAALRMHHAGLLALPDQAVPTEEHRRDPTADDWVLLVGDWLGTHLSRTGDARDEQVVAAVRRALPAVGYVWTKRGIRRGRSPVDRVLARSEAKTTATVAIVATEQLNLGERLRMLVLCDHERASATLPVDLRGVIDQQSGSAHAVLTALLADAGTAALHPLLVTANTVAGGEATLALLRSTSAVDGLRIEPVDDGAHRLVGPWTSRDWVREVTRFFEAGHTQVLVGTRGLLGEGWDARRITGLIDLTAVTTTTAVTQTRGRTLRVDPHWPEKVALTWSVVCVSDEHPKGGNDWDRLVRKHQGVLRRRRARRRGRRGRPPRSGVLGVRRPAGRRLRRRQCADDRAFRGPRVDPGGVAGGGAVRRPGGPDDPDPAHATRCAGRGHAAGARGRAAGRPGVAGAATPTGAAHLGGGGPARCRRGRCRSRAGSALGGRRPARSGEPTAQPPRRGRATRSRRAHRRGRVAEHPPDRLRRRRRPANFRPDVGRRLGCRGRRGRRRRIPLPARRRP